MATETRWRLVAALSTLKERSATCARRAPARGAAKGPRVAEIMAFDVELMRELLLVLEARELSPRSTVILDIAPIAGDLDRAPALVSESLDALLALGYIEGPGADRPGTWFFRKLTRKGVQFIQATRSLRDWEQMKRYFDATNDPSRIGD